MKKIILIILLLFSIKSIACSCDAPPIHQKYIKSDIVAKIKVIKIYKNIDNNDYYKADILVKKIYKGIEIESINIYGDNGRNYKTSCDIFIPEGAELIIYTSKNEEGYGVGMCSGYLYLNNSQKWQKEKNKLELKILNKLKQKNVKFTNKNNGISPMNLFEPLQKFNNIKVRKCFAIFEIVFKLDSSEAYKVQPEDIKVISGFNKKLDLQLIEILKNNKWYGNIKEGQPSRCLFVIKYVKETEKKASRIIHFF